MADPKKRVLGSFKKPPAPPPAAVPPAEAKAQADAALAGAAGIPLVKGPAQFPQLMKPGTVLTDFEREGMKELGIDPSAPLPGDLAARIAAAQAELSGPVPLPVGLDTPPLVPPKPVDIKDLPVAKREEIAAAVRQFQSAVREQGLPSAADPSPRAAAPQAGGRSSVEFVNDLAPPTPPVVDHARKVADTVAAQVAAAQAETPSAGGELAPHPANCPHCGHDLKLLDTTVVTDDDKLNFVQAILGGTRFKKKYELLGGKLRLVFRSLTTAESDMAFRQVSVDAQSDIKNRLINDTTFYWRNLISYRMVMALESTDSDVNGLIEVPPIDQIEVDADAFSFPDTKLSAVHDRIVADVLPVEQLRAMVGHLYNEFQAVCDKLQVMAEQPDFWTAIG